MRPAIVLSFWVALPLVATAFCPDFLSSEKSCTCYSYVDGAVIDCEGPDGPRVVEKLKTSNTEIRQLSITNADIIEIGPKAFRNLRIKSLVLDHNRIRTIHSDAFRGLEFSLLHLSLGHNKLTEVPTDSLIGMSNLQTLDLSCNNIGDLIGGPVFRNVTSIIELNLSCNQICKVSREAFEGLKDSLQSLILDQNCLHEVPAEALRGFKNMLGLHLQHNQIESLDKLQFMNLLSLLMVRLSGNQIRTVDKQAFNNIPNLRYLFLDRNKLTSIEPNTLQQFKFLEIVDLSFNDIGEIPTGAFSQMDHLMQLNLEGNTITDISPGAFAGSPLLLLLLGQNCLASVTQQTFQGISFLRQLSLTHNNLRLIQPFAFASLPSLQLLDLTSNHIESLQPTSFTFSQQATVLVQENPVVCSQGFHIIQGGQGIHLLNQPNAICSGSNSANSTCPSKRNISAPPTCCNGKAQNTSGQHGSVDQPNLSRFIKVSTVNTSVNRLPTSTSNSTVKVETTLTTSTTAPITSTLPSPVTKSLNLERFWRLTAAPKTIRLSRPESNTQGDRRPLESNIRLLATTEPNQPTRLLRTSMGPSELSWSTTGPQQEIPTIGGSSVQFSQSQFGQGIPESAFNPQNQFGQTRFSLGPSPFQFQQDPQIQQVPETFRQGLNGFQPLQQQRTFEPSQFPPFLLNPPQPTVLPPEHRGVVSNFFGEQNGTVQHQQTLINNLQPNNDIIQPQSFTPRPTFVSPSSHVPQFSNEISRLNPTILQLTGTSHSPRLLQQFPVGFDQRERSNFGPPQNPEVQFNQDRSWPGSQTTH